MSERVGDLTTQCRKHEENWTLVSGCLSEIENDSSLSDLSTEALQRARQHVRDSLELQTRAFKQQNIGAWLHTSDFKSTVGEIIHTTYLQSCQSTSHTLVTSFFTRTLTADTDNSLFLYVTK